MTKGDKFLLVGLLMVSLISMGALFGRFFFFPARAEAMQAVVSVKGEVVRRIDLASESGSSLVVRGEAGPSTVQVEGGRVRMQEAPCPGGVCVRQSWIGRPGESIVCVPGEIVVRIEGAAPLDAVTR